jgi:hypothetical protein
MAFKSILDDPECRSDEEKAQSTDNVIGAFGKCLLFQYGSGTLLNAAAAKEFLNLLPLYSDSEEA